MEGEGDRAQRVVDVDDDFRARVRARARESPEPSDDVPGLEEHRRHEHGARALVDGFGQALGQRVRRQRREADDLEPGLRAPSELAAQGVELAVGAHEAWALVQVQRREQADDELVRVDAQGDLAVGVAEQRPEAGAHLLGLCEGPPPLLVHVARGVHEGLDVALERDVRPRLMRVPGQQQPLGDAEARVVVGQWVHRRLRTAHRSGKAASKSVVRR